MHEARWTHGSGGLMDVLYNILSKNVLQYLKKYSLFWVELKTEIPCSVSFQSKELLWRHESHSEPYWSHTLVTVFLTEISSIFQPDMKFSFNPSKLILLLTLKGSNIPVCSVPWKHTVTLKARTTFPAFIETKLQKCLIQLSDVRLPAFTRQLQHTYWVFRKNNPF